MALILPDACSYSGLILGIDPGTNTLGTAFLTFDVRDLTVTGVIAETFKAEKHIDETEELGENHGIRFLKLIAQQQNLRAILHHRTPNAVAVESPFYNRLRPGAYGPLVEVMTVLRMTVAEHNYRTKFFTYDPPTVKRSVGCYATSKEKLDTQTAVMKIDEIVNHYLEPTLLPKLDEHSIDAIAVAYTHLQQARKGT